MSYVQFFVDFAARGEVLGLGLGSPPEAWAAVLGTDFADYSRRLGLLSRDFGLIETDFTEDSGTWNCSYVALNVSELQSGDLVVPAAVLDRFGSFPDRVPFDEIADAAAGAGVAVYHARRTHPASLEQYWIPGAGVMFWLISEAQVADFPGLQIGDVYSATRLAGVDVAPEDRTRYR